MANHAERIQKIVARAAEANQRLIDALNALPETSTQVAPAGTWHAAQIGAHVAMTNSLVAAIFRGDVPAERAPAPDFVEDWHSLVIPEKITTMPQLEPAVETTRAAAIKQLDDSLAAVTDGLSRVDESRATNCVDLPFGTINLYMLGEFVGAHSDRHLAQLMRLPVVT